MPWNPDHYLAFGELRQRPALDLLAAIPPWVNPATALDLGCGPGNVTALLQRRWPRAALTGVDCSAEMLARAAADHPGIAWLAADLATWPLPAGTDLIFSNAALHWLDDHPALFLRLMASLAPGGVLAVQMPDNFASPSHLCALQAAQAGPWRSTLAPLLRPAPVLAAEAYHDVLAPHARQVDIWQTEYLQVLAGENPVADWLQGSLLVPLLAALEAPERSAFEADFRRRVASVHPPRGDGLTLFPFRRLFLVAVK